MEFKPEMFNELNPTDWYVENPKEEVAEFCNKKLKEWLDAAPTVYGRSGISGWFPEGPGVNTHEGKLVCIKEIKK